jgi:hypothetical protein
MDTAFRTTFTNRFTQKPVDLKLGQALNEAEVSSFSKDLDGSIVHSVQIGANYLNVNSGHRSTTVGDWNMVKAITNVITDDMLGLIHAKDVGFHVSGNLKNLPAYKEGIGIVRRDYAGEYADLIHGKERLVPAAGQSPDNIRAAFEGAEYFYLDLKNGGLYVGKKAVHVAPTGDPRLQSINEQTTNNALYRQQAIDLLMSGASVHCIWPDYRQNYLATKWAQFNMDVATLASDKRERIARKIGRAVTSVAYAEVAQAQSVVAQTFADTGVEEPVTLTMPTESIKLMVGNKVEVVPLDSIGPCKLERFMLGVRLPTDAILGDDAISRFMVARQAKGGTIFRIAA